MGAESKVRIDSSNCRAICEEIGERLRIVLDREASALPPNLQVLMLRLAAQDLAEPPPIAPAMDGMAEVRTAPVLAA